MVLFKKMSEKNHFSYLLFLFITEPRAAPKGFIWDSQYCGDEIILFRLRIHFFLLIYFVGSSPILLILYIDV